MCSPSSSCRFVKSLDMILSGKILSAQKSYKYGFIDEVLPQSLLKKRGLDLAQKYIKNQKLPARKQKSKSLLNFFLESFFGRPIVYITSKARVLKQTKGFYPAPIKALEVIKQTYGFSCIKKALQKEMDAFCDVAVTSQSKNLVRLFFLMDSVKKQKTLLSKASSASPIKEVGLLGAGIMGGGIAYVCSDRGYKVRIKDIQENSLSVALKQAQRLWEKQYKQRRINKYEWEERSFRLSPSLTYSGFSSLDCVIEAITEDEKIKKSVIQACSKHLTSSTIFASNTSSLSIQKLSEVYPWPENFVGMHFFNPVYKMPLVEIIKTEQTSEESVEKVYQFAKALGKTPIVVKDSPGFVVNRILIPYLIEALWLLEDGKTALEIDHLFTHDFGLPMGPLRLMDEVGLDVCIKIIRIFESSNLGLKIPSWIYDMEKTLGLGRKAGKGFYEYKSQGVFLNKDLSSFVPSSKKHSFSNKEARERGVYLLINESFKVYKEGLVNSKDDLDLALILGIGFPPFLGGPIRYAEALGLEKVKGRLEEFSVKWGERFKPSSAF